MKFKPKKFLSLLTASLLAAGGLVGLAAAPASAAPVAYTTFEDNDTSGYTLGGNNNFGGAGSSREALSTLGLTGATASPAAPSGYVAKVSRPSNAQTWAGTTFSSLVGKEFISQDDQTVTVDIYTERAVTVMLKLEAGASYLEKSLQSSGAGWQRVSFDFTAPTASLNSEGYIESKNYSVANIFFDFGQTGVAGDYYFDNVTYTQHLTCAISTAPTRVSWDSTDTTGASPVVFEGAQAAVEAAPSGSYSGNVNALKVTKPAGGQAWAGVTILNDGCSNFAAGTTVTANVYPTVAMGLMLKVEPAGVVSEFPLSSPLVANRWQTVTWTIGTLSGQKSKISFFPDFMTAASGQVVYIDDISFNGATAPTLDTYVAPSAPTPTVNLDVRLISSLKNTSTSADEVVDPCNSDPNNNWCLNKRYYIKMLEAGSTTNVTYIVTDHDTSAPVANASVSLRINTGYSGSNATWTSGGSSVPAVSSSSSGDGFTATGTTNSAGEVTFALVNTNTSGEAARTLSDANPYPTGCNSPAGQTKAAIEALVTSVPGANRGTQYIDVFWPHITSTTINSSIAAGSDGSNCSSSSSSSSSSQEATSTTTINSPRTVDPDNKGQYPHIRLEKSFMENKFDASWWDGVWQFRDADTKAYLKYIPVGSTFKLTYVVTDDFGAPLADASVSLIVNANYSCSKTFFAYEGSLIGPDDCAGGGETELPAKKTDANGRVSFVLTNTNTTGEAMPADLNGLPNGKELGTNIKPNLVGAKRQGIDMLFAHFVESSDASKVSGSGTVSATIGKGHSSTFTFLDAAGKPMARTDVKYYVNGFDSKSGFAVTDGQGRVTIPSTNSSGQAGMQTVGVSLDRDGKLPLFATATINWEAPALAVSAAGSKGAVVVKVAGASGKTVKITIAGKAYTRVAKSENDEFSIATSAGKKAVKVSVAGKTLSKSVTVTKK